MKTLSPGSAPLFALEDLDDILRADIVVVLKRHTAFLTGLHFLDLVLEALERLQSAFVDHHVVAQKAYTSRTAGDTFCDQTASNLADARHLEDFADLA